MEKNIDSFEKYKMVHYFMHPNEPLKKWINETNFINTYKNDWNGIMPVVEKIESVSEVLFGYFEGAYFIKWKTDNEPFIIELEETKLLSVYKAVIEFIKWYNQKSK